MNVQSYSAARLNTMFNVRGRNREELAEQIRKNPNTVGGWIKNGPPSRRSSVIELCDALSFPPHYLEATAPPPQTSVPFFRSRRKLDTSKHVENARAYGFLVGEVSRLLTSELGSPHRRLENLSIRRSNPQQAARDLRHQVHVGSRPIDNICEFAWRVGVIVVFGPRDQRDLDSYSLWVDGWPVIVLNPESKDPYRLRFDVAHELAHLVMHKADTKLAREPLEHQADQFAGELLYPTSMATKSDLFDATRSTNNWQRLLRLKSRFGMSLLALLFQAKAMGVIDDFKHRQWLKEYKAKGFYGSTEWAMPREEVFMNVLRDAASRRPHENPFTDAASEFGLPGDVLEAILADSPTSVNLRSPIQTRTLAERSRQLELPFDDL